METSNIRTRSLTYSSERGKTEASVKIPRGDEELFHRVVGAVMQIVAAWHVEKFAPMEREKVEV